MSSIRYIYVTLFLAGCGLPFAGKEKAVTFQHQDDFRQQSEETNSNIPDAAQSFHMENELGGIKFLADIDESGNVTILNYPSEWQAKVHLIHFDNQTSEVLPFSFNHCEKIRNIASIRHSETLVRNGYRTVLLFEHPAFLTDELITAVRKKAEKEGLNFPAYYLKNPVDKVNSVLELRLSDSAISNLLGNIEALKGQLHLGQKGAEKDFFQKEVTIFSADIICDLVSGEAKMAMIYPIKGGNRTIKVIYNPLEIRLASR